MIIYVYLGSLIIGLYHSYPITYLCHIQPSVYTVSGIVTFMYTPLASDHLSIFKPFYFSTTTQLIPVYQVQDVPRYPNSRWVKGRWQV